MNPRAEIEEHIKNTDLDTLLKKSAQIHGHFCPGLSLGVMAACKAMQLINLSSDGLEDILAIVETNNCFSDGIQFVCGCTFGNNSLIYKDFGKTAFTLTKRNGKGIRISTKSDSRDYIRKQTNKFSSNYQKVVKEHDHSEESIEKFKITGFEKSLLIIKMDFDQIFKIENIETKIPSYAPSHESVICAKCSESIMSSRIVKKGKEKYCKACSNDAFYQLDGFGIKEISTNKKS